VSGPRIIQTAAPAYWASYLVNGDSSGLDAREIDLADKWQARVSPAFVVAVATDKHGLHESPYFSWSYGAIAGDDSCAGGDLLDYILHLHAGAEALAL